MTAAAFVKSFKLTTSMKKYLKQFALIASRYSAFSVYLFYRLDSKLLGERKAFEMITQSLSLIPGVTGEFFRRGFLQWVTGLRLADCCISFGVTFSDPRLALGDGIYIGRGCDIGYVHIEDRCLIGSNVHIISGLQQHGFNNADEPVKNQKGKFEKVIIGEDTWVGNGAIIGADIGKKCIIGAGAVVVKPVPDFNIVAGNPAKTISFRGN